MIDLLQAVTDWLLPQSCMLCGAHSGEHGICVPCRDELPKLTSAHCPRCAVPTPMADVCGACLKQPPEFDATVAAWTYTWPLDRLVPAFKYGKQLTLAKPLAAGVIAAASGITDRPDALLAMPMHPDRQKQRGFNQSQELARLIGRALQIPVRSTVAVRTRLTPPQASLPLEERRRAIKGAFATAGDVAGLHIAIIDDVMTSGASLDELAKTLKRAGARRVDCWLAARALRATR